MLSSVIVLGVLASPVFAQVNIEQIRRDSTDHGVTGAAGFDLAFRTGNVDIIKFDINARIDYVVGDFRTFVMAGGDFGWDDGKTFSSQAIVHLRQVFRGNASVKPELFQQINYDKLRALQFRGLLGGGLRFTLLRWHGSRVWYGTAYMLEQENLDLPADAVHPNRTTSHRWSNYISSRTTLDDRIGLVWTVYAQPRFDDPGDIRLLGDARLAFALAGSASMVTSFLARWDSRPPDDVEALDTTLRTGVHFSF